MSDNFEKVSFEKVDLSEDGVKYEKSDFAQVIFGNIAETYPTEAHVDCRFTVTPYYYAGSKDYVGLYKVGWCRAQDYVTYQVVKLPKDYQHGKLLDTSVLFQAHNLPHDDGEFYQFCYVTANMQVKGASIPFQFKNPSVEDFVEIEDFESGMTLIQTKTVAMEEELTKLKKEREEINQRLEELENERESLVQQLVEYDKNLQSETTGREETQKQLSETQERVQFLQTEIKEMGILNESLREKINQINQEKQAILKRLDENDGYITDLQGKIKGLINEKDALIGKNKSLEEEKELLKSHFSNSESTIQNYVQQLEKLNLELQERTKESDSQRETVGKLSQEIEDIREKLQEQLAKEKVDKVCIEGLNESRKNAEDKLMATEQCKELLTLQVTEFQNEVTAKDDEIREMRIQLLNAKEKVAEYETKTKTLSEQMTRQEELHGSENEGLKNIIRETVAELETKKQDLVSVEAKTRELEVQLNDQSENDQMQASLFASKKALEIMKERHAKAKKDLNEVVDELKKRERSWKDAETDCRREIVDLKERLQMGADEYKTKFVECEKLKKEVKKLRARIKESLGLSREVSVDKDVLQKSDIDESGSNTESQKFSPEEIADLTNREIQAQFEDIRQELEKRELKKKKYKQQLQEEKDKNAVLQKHYHCERRKMKEELGQKNQEIEDINKQWQEEKIALEKIIEELQKEQNDETLEEVKITYPPQQMNTEPEVTFVRGSLYPLQAQVPKSPAREGGNDTPGGALITPAPQHLPFTFGQENKEQEPDEEDPLDFKAPLAQPLTPLPPPISPQVLPSAKVAAVKALSANVPNSSQNDGEIRGDDEPWDIPGQADGAEGGDGEEENFHDAAGEPQRMCPICGWVFPDELSDDEISRHVSEHLERHVCPICNKTFKEDNTSEFERHVHTHFENE